MLPRANNNNEAVPLLAGENQLMQSYVLPKDVWVHLMQFCSLETIGRLARVNRDLNRVLTNANVEIECKVMRIGDEQGKLGYVKGTYANLRAFFSARQQDMRRIEELNESCCINMSREDDCYNIGMVGTMCFIISGVAGSGFTLAYYLGVEGTVPYMVTSLTTGGLSSFGPFTVCIGNLAACRAEERGRLLEKLRSRPTELHGAMFSLQPFNPVKDQEPARLMMN